MKSLREQSIQVHGPRLFNSLPAYLRNATKCGQEEYKAKLDQLFAKIPDQPIIGGLMAATCDQATNKPSNSLIDQIRVYLAGRMGTTSTI